MKFVFNLPEATRLVAWLSGRCRPDPDFPEGIVSSIYYDSMDWVLLREKLNSDYVKTKIRVRWYGDLETGETGEASFLEVKTKEGGLSGKTRIRTQWPGSWLETVPLNDSALLSVRPHLRSCGVSHPDTVVPAFVVRYNRVRFVEPVTGARLCIDWNIGAPRVNPQLLPGFHAFVLPFGVFEVKGGIDDLPPILHTMTVMGCRKQAVSKYLACYCHILRRDF